MRIIKLTEEERNNILENLLKRSPNQYSKFETTVNDILANVKANKDKALFEYTEQFDKVKITKDTIKVTKEEIEEAYTKVDEHLIEIIRKALVNIREYHQKQVRYSWFDSKPDGTLLGQKITALERVGVYVPGGKAVYPSSVLMNIVPAKVAGVSKIIMTTPPGQDGKVYPVTLVAANEAGVDEIYKVGGAQAIGALAFGTESIKKVDKIVGPGNIFVATAKRMVFGTVDIDMIAGPSEILIVADENANPRYVAADLMSQAEHDKLASSILITTSKDLYEAVEKELAIQVETLERKEIIKESLNSFGKVIICDSIDECIDISNIVAPEHLELMVNNPMEYLGRVKHAGSVFLGHNTPEPIGDYFGGTNHVLPTSGTARFSSALSVDSFIKKSSFLYYSERAIQEDGEKIINIANKEGLTAHANSVKVRLK